MAVLTRRTRRQLTTVGAALAVSALLAACSSSSSSSGGAAKTTAAPAGPTDKVLHLSFLQDPGQPPDPDVFYAGQGLLLTTNMYDGLLSYKPGTATPILEPALATSWTASKDFKTYTFKLRQGVTFHDGTPFTSAAVKVSFDRRTAVNQGPAYMTSDIASVTTQGDYAVTVNLKDSNSAFLAYMAAAYGPKMISPTGLAANAGSDHGQKYLATHDLGTGPYTLTDAKTGTHYAMKAYPKYWGPAPYFQTVDIPVITETSSQQLQFKSGQLAAILHDLPSSAVKSFIADKKFSNYTLPTMQSDYLYVNPNKGLFTDKSVRQALLKAVDTAAITKQAFFGRGTQGEQVYPANMIGSQYAKQNITYDSSALKNALASKSSAEKTITIGYDSSSPDNQLVANLMEATFAPLGLTAKVQSYPTSQIFGWIGDLKGSPDILVTAGWPDAPPPYTWGHISWDPGAGLNYLHCSDPKTTAALAKGLKSGADADFSEAAEDVLDTGCFLNLTNISDFVVAQPWLKGVENAHVVSNPNTLLIGNLSE